LYTWNVRLLLSSLLVTTTIAAASTLSSARAQAGCAASQRDDTGATPAGTSTDPQLAEGRAAFEQGRYREALEHFRGSYQANGRPELLCDIGEAAYKLGRKEEALSAFRQYLQQLPDGSERLRVEERLEHLNIELEKERNRPPPPEKREKRFEGGGQALIGYFASDNPDLSFGFGLQARFGVAIIRPVLAEVSLAAVDAPKSESEGGGVLGISGRTGVRYYHFAMGDPVPFLGTGVSFNLWYTTLRTYFGGISASDTGFSIDANGGAMFPLSDSARAEVGLQCTYSFANDVFYEKGMFWLALSVGASYLF
jgi:tetratricopeptide (TPR) repeat protein